MVDALASLMRQYSTLNLNGLFYTLIAQYTILMFASFQKDIYTSKIDYPIISGIWRHNFKKKKLIPKIKFKKKYVGTL